ncbi:Small auxin-up RNA [Trema orientale]|uniref:Small auxin-up RNA n=1 Tax=Trema orientale TaxID=63057 RepID=A0A2P5CKD0_TREOI|nr:Small auxin-up RNA [Trema orientale]
MARKRHKLVWRGSKTVSFSGYSGNLKAKAGCRTTFVAERGHFVIYSSDHRRFMLPLTYLRHEIFQKLLKISEEEFGLSICGPLILPCDSVFIDSLVSLIQRSGMARNLEKAQLNWINIVSSSLQLASTAFRHGYFDHHLVTCCYY